MSTILWWMVFVVCVASVDGCMCLDDGVIDCGPEAESVVVLDKCPEARTVFIRGFCTKIVNHRHGVLASIIITRTTLSCGEVLEAVPTQAARVNDVECEIPSLKLKTQPPRPPSFPVDDNDDDDDDDNGADDNDDDDDDDGTDQESNGNETDGDTDAETDDDDYLDTNTTSTPLQRSTRTFVIVAQGSVYLYRWLLAVTIVVVVLGSGSWCVFVRVRARRRRQTDRRVQYSEVSSTTPEVPTYVIEPSTSRSPRRRRGSMESVTLFSVDEC